jgi:hypothetical protein
MKLPLFFLTLTCALCATQCKKAEVAPLLPDLIVKSIFKFELANNNTQVRYYCYVTNLGNTASTIPVGLQGYWSKDNILDSNDVPAGGLTAPTIATFEAVEQSFTMNVPNPQFYPAFTGYNLQRMLKEYPYLILEIDSNKQVTESNEDNNTLAQQHFL